MTKTRNHSRRQGQIPDPNPIIYHQTGTNHIVTDSSNDSNNTYEDNDTIEH